MPSDRRPLKGASHLTQWEIACGINLARITKGDAPGAVMNLICALEIGSAPDWTRAPGSPAGLAALAAIARELGYAVTAPTDDEHYRCTPNTYGLAVAFGKHGWLPYANGSKQEVVSMSDIVFWKRIAHPPTEEIDPANLPKLLHLLLALRPAT